MNGREKRMNLADLTSALKELQTISEYVIQYDVDIVKISKMKIKPKLKPG